MNTTTCSSCGYNPCSCANALHSFNWNTIPDQSCNPCSDDIVCKYLFPAKCVIYNGPPLTCFGLGTNINIEIIIASIHSILCGLLDSQTCNAPYSFKVGVTVDAP